MLEGYGFQEYMKRIRAYTREILKVPARDERLIQNFMIPVKFFELLEYRSDPDLYDYIADMPYGIRGVEKNVTSFIPKLTNQDLRKLYIYHKGEPVYQYYSGYNIDYSLKRLTEKQKAKLERYKKIGNWKFIRNLNNFFRSQKQQKVCNSKYDLIAQKVIIFGAGKKGQLLYKQLTEGHKYHADVLLWVDTDFEKCMRNRLPVECPEKIGTVKYDQVVIAVAKKELAEEIKESLIQMGVPDYRILWINPVNQVGER